MGYLLVWLLFGFVAGIIGHNKGVGGIAFAIGFLLGPFGLLIVIFMRGERKQCPYCMSLIHISASICPKCHKEQYPQNYASPVSLQDNTSVYKSPDETSEILCRAPASWKMAAGEEHSGWMTVEIIGDAPASRIGLKGWVKVEVRPKLDERF